MKKEMKNIIRKGIDVVMKTGEPDTTTWQEFFIIIISYLSFNRKIDLIKVRDISIKISEKYNLLMSNLDTQLIDPLVNIITCLKNWKSNVYKVLDPTLNEIEEMKDVIDGKGNKSHATQVITVS